MSEKDFSFIVSISSPISFCDQFKMLPGKVYRWLDVWRAASSHN
jgi:hypothetical protein